VHPSGEPVAVPSLVTKEAA